MTVDLSNMSFDFLTIIWETKDMIVSFCWLRTDGGSAGFILLPVVYWWETIPKIRNKKYRALNF